MRVQADEMFAIAGKDGTTEACCINRLVRIRDSLIRPPFVYCRQHIMAELAQPLHNGEGEVLVCV